MFLTKHGPYDGDTWEALIQICLRIKYEAEQYYCMPASPGDFGIEGFTNTGKAFQCYCPDNTITSDELYDKQRNKITTDLNKLQKFEKQLQDYLRSTRIKEWIFVTPEYRKKELVKHCRDKAEDIKNLGLSIVDSNFEVLIHDIDNFSSEIPIALSSNGKKMYLTADEADVDVVTRWKEHSNSLVDNALRKHAKRFPITTMDIDLRANKLTDITVRDYLNRESVLAKWRKLHPEHYDKFLVLASQIENEVREKCMFPVEDNNQLYKEIKENVHSKIKSGFSYMDDININHLANGLVAYWLLRCPLDFE